MLGSALSLLLADWHRLALRQSIAPRAIRIWLLLMVSAAVVAPTLWLLVHLGTEQPTAVGPRNVLVGLASAQTVRLFSNAVLYAAAGALWILLAILPGAGPYSFVTGFAFETMGQGTEATVVAAAVVVACASTTALTYRTVGR